MTVQDYIQQRFQTFGISLSEADLLDICFTANIDLGDELCSDNHSMVNVGIAKFIPALLLRATSVGESGFSMSWDMNGIKNYYSYLCKRYGLKDEINTDKPRVKFL